MKNIVLIGMPGAGKSTVGVVLAKTLGMAFIDTDLLIQEREKRLLQGIINDDGIGRFLEIEERAILTLVCKGAVVATGGSAVYSDKAMQRLKQNGIIVYLKISYDEMIRRINDIKTRGIVLEKGQNLYDIYKHRIPLYERYSDIVIDSSNKGIETIIENIKNALKES